MPLCPQNHPSETADYCSVCGAEIAPAPAPTGPGPGASPAPALHAFAPCPACGASPDRDGQVFCEVCGFNFKTGKSGTPPPSEPPAAAVAPAVPAAGVVVTPLPAPASTADRWDLTVRVDPDLYGTTNPDAPADRPEQRFSLFETESLLGRASAGVRVQVPVAGDPGISRRHAIFVRSGQSIAVRDLGSANGTQLNGVDLVSGVDSPIKDRDTLAVGAWTRVTIHAVQS